MVTTINNFNNIQLDCFHNLKESQFINLQKFLKLAMYNKL